MNRADLDTRHSAVIARYARSLDDTGGRAPRALLDDLAAIADEYRFDVAGYRIDGRIYHPADVEIVCHGAAPAETAGVTTLRDDYGHGDGSSSGAPPLVAADPAATAPTPSPSSVARTRTRTRGGAK